MTRSTTPILLGLALFWTPHEGVQRVRTPGFVTHDVASGLRGGYQVVAADLNRDGRPDLIAVASSLTELVWFENPERSAGIVSLLPHGTDPRTPWSIREIDRVPTSHRVRWYSPAGGTSNWLINAPLVHATARAPDYRGATPVYAYRAPSWQRELVSESQQGVVRIYATAADTRTWTRTMLDAGQMGAAGCAAADLNLDGRTDLACIATASATLKWYENVGRP